MINIEDAHLNVAAASHPGMSGKKNEDRYMVSAFLTSTCQTNGDQPELPSVLAVVCDGIGGHRAGEVAAQMGVTIITETVRETPCEETSDDEPVQDVDSQPLNRLEGAIQRANHAIYQASLTDQGRKGMGATCACAWVIDDRLYTANLGDSRIYLLREGHILQLTTDHTWLQEAYDAGIIDEINIDIHPNAHVIRRYLGSAKKPEVDFRLWFYEGEGDGDALDNQGLPLAPGDVLLICSDGLTDLVSDEEIFELVMSSPLDQAPAALINLANVRGGHDNITVVLMAVPSGKRKLRAKAKADRDNRKIRARDVKSSGPRRRWLFGCLAVLFITILLVGGVFFGMRWWADRPVPVTGTSTPERHLTLLIPTQTEPDLVATMTPTPTSTSMPIESLATPRPTLTPWPTHTTVP